jgi:Zn-dependent protease with chaperone function
MSRVGQQIKMDESRGEEAGSRYAEEEATVVRRWGLAVSLVVATFGMGTPAVADEPGWYERYLVDVICARTRCVRDPSAELPPGTVEHLESVWMPLRRVSRIPVGEPVRLVFTHAREPNAWALKHYWGITAGLRTMPLSRDELAFVVAHEFAHIELGHYQKKLNEIAKIYALAAIALILTQGNYNPLNDPYFTLAARLAMAAYSREQEVEADVRAIQMMQAAGFDDRASVTMLERFRVTGVLGTGDLFDSHPSVAQRIARIQRELPPRPAPMPAPAAVSTPSPGPAVVPAPGPSPAAAGAVETGSSPTPAPTRRSPSPTPTSAPAVRVIRAIGEREEAGVVLVGERVVMRIRTSHDGLHPFERARLAAERLGRLLSAGLMPADISAGLQAGQSVILARGEVILTIDPELARMHGASPGGLALRWAKEIREAVAALR